MPEVQPVFTNIRHRYAANVAQVGLRDVLFDEDGNLFDGEHIQSCPSASWVNAVKADMPCAELLLKHGTSMTRKRLLSVLGGKYCQSCYWNGDITKAGCEIIAPETDLFVRQLDDGRIEINGTPYNKLTVDIGGATVLSSLRLVNGPPNYNACMIVDPNAGVASEVLKLISEGRFEEIGMRIMEVANYSEIPLQLVQEVISLQFQQWANNIKGNLNAIFPIKGKIPDIQLGKIADIVTCYHPSPLILSPYRVIESAQEMLKNGGRIELVTENIDYFLELTEYLREVDLPYKLKVVNIKDLSLPLSVYDIFSPYMLMNDVRYCFEIPIE